MSSTSSSEQPTQKRSATDILASRYRHLFVLPSTLVLAFYSAIGVYLLTAVSRGALALVPFVLAFAVTVLAGSATSSALRIADKGTIATFRRTLAVVIAGEALLLVCAIFGAAYGVATGSPTPLTNAMLFGAFVTAGFEFMVINGTFTENAGLSTVLAVIHPAATLIVLRFQEVVGGVDPVAALSGVAAMAVVGLFTSLLKRRRTSLGFDALSLFRSFMKTWVAAQPGELEGIIAAHSEDAEVSTKIMRFSTEKGDNFVVLPGVHPGPFHPIGSYDLPGVISREFKGVGTTMTLHMPGGHERNLSTNAETARYADGLRDYAATIEAHGDVRVRGPVHAQIGRAKVAGAAFSDDLILTVSFSPYGSDDLSPEVGVSVTGMARGVGLDASVVDAHNSIADRQENPDLTDPGWKALLAAIAGAGATEFRVAYSNSKELGFKGEGDLTENGISLFMVAAERKSVLVLADANNAAPGLREETQRALEAAGYDLFEFCTSDSHNLAARGLTVERGYQALGEVTPAGSIARLVVEMAKAAEARLLPAAYGSGEVKTRVKVFGSVALEEFAQITQSSSKLARAYARFGVASVAVLLGLSILL